MNYKTIARCPVCRTVFDEITHHEPEMSGMGGAMLLGPCRREHAAVSPACTTDPRWIRGWDTETSPITSPSTGKIVTKYICTPGWQEPGVVAIEFEELDDFYEAIDGQRKKARKLLHGQYRVVKHDARLHDTKAAAINAAIAVIRKQIQPLGDKIKTLVRLKHAAA
jgi:hypothetical protein